MFRPRLKKIMKLNPYALSLAFLSASCFINLPTYFRFYVIDDAEVIRRVLISLNDLKIPINIYN